MPNCYLNTDLDLTAAQDLSPLAAALAERGIRALHVTPTADGLWYAIFETDEPFTEPEPNLSAMLTAVESLGEPELAIWRACTHREFNVGYDSGKENHTLPADTLRRMAAVGVSLGISLYPHPAE